MANSTSHAALPYPIKNARFTILVPYLDATGTPTDPTTPDTEFSGDGGAFADCLEEITTVSGSNGEGYITLTGAELNYSMVGLAFKVASGPKATLATLYPRVLSIVGSGTLSAGSAGGGTLGTLLSYDITGCFIRTSGGTGGGGTGGANNQARKILTYTTTTGVFTVVPNWETTPDATTTYDVLLPEGVTLGMLRALNPATAGRTVVVDALGLVDANTVKVGPSGSGTTQTAGDIPSRLPTALTANGNIKSSLVEILTTALTETSGLLAGGFKKWFNVPTPTGTINSLPDFVAGATSGLALVGSNVGVATSVSGAVGSVGSAVSVTGDLSATMKTSVTTAASAATPVVTVGDKTGFSLSSAGLLASWSVLSSDITTSGSIGKWILDKLDAVVSTIKSKTDNLPVSPAAVGSAMTLTANERTSIANEVEAQIIDETDSEKVLTAITDKIASVNPSLGSLTLAAIASAVRDQATAGASAGSIGAALAALAARLPGSGVIAVASDIPSAATIATTAAAQITTDHGSGLYTRNTEPLDATGTRAAIGESVANLDTQLATIAAYIDTEIAAIKAKTDNLPSDPADASDIASSFSSIASTLSTIASYIDTEVAAIKTKTDNLPSDPADASDIASSFATLNSLVSSLNNLNAATVRTQVDNALATYDAPTHSEMTTELASADDATLAAISAISIPTAAQNADTLLDRKQTGGGTGSAGFRVRDSFCTRFTTNGTTITFYDADGDVAFTRHITREDVDALTGLSL